MDLELWRKKKKEQKLTFEDIAKATSISISALKDIFRGATPHPRIDTVRAIETVLFTTKEEKQELISRVDFEFDREIEMIDIIQSGKNKVAYYSTLKGCDKENFIFLMLLSDKELQLQKLGIQAQKQGMNKFEKLEWIIDGKVPSRKFDNDEQ